MSASTVNQYKIYCQTESTYVSGWGTTAPTVCYNNNAHTVNANSVQLIQTVSSNTVTINQNGSYQTQYKIIDAITATAAGNSTASTSYVFDVNSSIYSFELIATSIDIGDTLNVALNPNTSIGLVAQDLASGSTTVYVNPLVISKLHPGFLLSITDGTNTDNLGKILSINSTNSSVVVKTAPTNSYSSTNAVLKLTYCMANNVPVTTANMQGVGTSMLNASQVPAGTTLVFTYTNSGSETKTIALYLSMMI